MHDSPNAWERLSHATPAALSWSGARHGGEPAHHIRIAAHAIDGKRPGRELILSADLAIVIDGLTLPVAALVNGATIRRDLAGHEPLVPAGTVADGLAIVRAPDTAALPSAAIIGMHARLLDQAQRMGWTLTDAPALHLTVGEDRITPVRMDRGWYAFPIPGGVRDMRIVSRAGIPADLDPQSNDTRRLGVMIDRLIIRCRQREREFALRDRALAEGFHPPDSNGLTNARWTDGNARLRLTRAARTRAELLLHVERGQRCWAGPLGTK